MSHERQYLPGFPGSRRTWWIERFGWVGAQAERVWHVLLYSSAYLSIIAMIEVAMAMVLLSLPLSFAPLIVGLVTFAVYANDRIADVDTDAVTKPRQAAFVDRWGTWLYVFGAGAYGLAVALSVLGGPVALFLTLVPGVFWVLYATDWIPNVGSRVSRLKEILFLNSIVVALAWAVSLTFLPLVFAGRGLSPAVGFVFGYFFLRSFVDTELPNVHDLESDTAAGVQTMPVAFGITRTRNALIGIDLLTVGLVVTAVALGYLGPFLAVALGVGLLYSVGMTALATRNERRSWVTLAPEFEYLVVGLAFLPLVLG